MINEELARRNKENYSHFGYVAGSATREFNVIIANATEKIEQAKLKVSDEGKVRLDKLLAAYTTNYTNWINKSNANGANHVSVMIAGPSNYNMRAHEKYIQKERTIIAEYDNIKDIESKIYAIINGDKIIKSDDVNAIEKLQEKLAKAQEEHQRYKDFNIKARKEGTQPLASWVLQNSNGRMKSIKDRITQLERLAKAAEATPQIEIVTESKINGIKIIDNLEAQRLQIIFDDKPDAMIRAKLRKNGFRWSPTKGAWQRFRSLEAERIAKEIVRETIN